MTQEEFARNMAELGCDPKAIHQVTGMIGRFLKSYPWLLDDELHAIALSRVEDAQTSYDSEGEATFVTWLVTIIRNSIRSYLRREAASRKKVEGMVPVEGQGVYQELSAIEEHDIFREMAALLSPGAWAIVKINLANRPKKVSNTQLSNLLSVSPRSIAFLRREAEFVGRLLKDERNF